MVKQLHINQRLLIALDLFQAHYQVLLILYMKFTAMSLNDVKNKSIKSVCDLLDLKNLLDYSEIRIISMLLLIEKRIMLCMLYIIMQKQIISM